MKALVINDYISNLSDALKGIGLIEMPVPAIKENEVLVKMEYSSCNPSDIAFLRGMYNFKKPLPAVMGFEGCGTVVRAGAKSNLMEGQRVSCFTQENDRGSWAEYLATDSLNCISLQNEMDMKQAAGFFVNPFTAFALYEMVTELKAKAFIINAATGQIGAFLRTFAKKDNKKVINLIRRKQHIELLKEKGEEYVFNTREDGFENELKKLSHHLNATLAFDAVGGEMTSKLFHLMPEGSTIVVYGGLSGMPVSNLDILDLIFNDKKIMGFNLNHWMRDTSRLSFSEASALLQKMFITGIINTQIQAVIKPWDAFKGIYQYITRMSDGKVLIDWSA